MATKKSASDKAPTWGEDTSLGAAVLELNEINERLGVEMRGGKKYTMVKDRVEIFRKHFGHRYGIETSIEYCDDTYVRMKAVVTEATVMGNEVVHRVVGSGHAEELRGSTNVNKTSAVENAETGAIGRALASIGIAGSEYASANEMEAVGRKEEALQTKPAKKQSKPKKEDKATVISPDGRDTHVTTEDDTDLKDLVYEAMRVFMPDCDTTEHLNEFLKMNTDPIDVLRDTDRWDDFVKLGEQQREKIKQIEEKEKENGE